MLTNLLGRQGRPFELLVGSIEDPPVSNRLAAILHAAAVARLISGARIARVGRPIDGYDCVDTDSKSLRAAIGAELVPIEPSELQDRYRAITDIGTLESEVAAGFEDITTDQESRTRSLRLAIALEELDQFHGFHAGAMNCHVPEIRFGDDPGLTPCFGLGRETTRGIPWTCAGDVLTAVAMLVAHRLGGAALCTTRSKRSTLKRARLSSPIPESMISDGVPPAPSLVSNQTPGTARIR